MKSDRPILCLIVLNGLAFSAFHLSAAILSTNPPSQPLTAERIATLPQSQHAVWMEYLAQSKLQRKADQEFLKLEMQREGVKQLSTPPETRSRSWISLSRTSGWYGSPEARHIADCILSFQTPAGGWSKNLDMSGNLRAPGMLFAAENVSAKLSDGDFDIPLDRNWNYVGTFDNDATVSQLRFLAKVVSAITNTNESARYRTAVVRGIRYICHAQYPNGGWPQVWPLSGGYHDSITFNDNAMVNVLGLLRDVAAGTNDFAFIPNQTRSLAADAYQHGLDCVLAAQVVANGQPTIWAQQYDMLTLQPDSARNYEMPSLASGESAAIMMFLMQVPKPSPKIVSAVHNAAAWFSKNEIRDQAFKNSDGNGRRLVPSPGSGPIWARYYEIGSDQPLFGDRDKTIHDSVNDISKERRNGYAWYGDGGKRALEQYSRWAKKNPAAEAASQ